jgi:hypothetical protein
MSKHIYKRVTGWSLFLEQQKVSNPNVEMTPNEFKLEMQKAYKKLAVAEKNEFRDNAREVNLRLSEAKKIGIGGFLDELRTERQKPAD